MQIYVTRATALRALRALKSYHRETEQLIADAIKHRVLRPATIGISLNEIVSIAELQAALHVDKEKSFQV